jgi:hypothetical protein
MRCSFLFTAVLIVCNSSNLLSANDDLFSQVAMETVFEKATGSESAENEAKRSEATVLSRVTGTAGLKQLLQGSQFEYEVNEGQLTLKLARSGWGFPVRLRVDVERDCILCDLSLVQLKDAKQIDHRVLLRLMAAGDPSKRAFFAFDPAEKVVQLRASFSNRHVTPSGLVRELEGLAQLADSRASIWSELSPKQEKQAKTSRSDDPKPTAASSQPGSSLEGQWSASLNQKEAFAVRFDRSGRFALVHLRDGKSTQSTGKFSLQGNQLMMSGDDGVRLTSKLTWRGSQALRLEILGSSGKPGIRLDFKKLP